MEPPEKFVEHLKKVLEILQVSTRKIFGVLKKKLYKFLSRLKSSVGTNIEKLYGNFRRICRTL